MTHRSTRLQPYRRKCSLISSMDRLPEAKNETRKANEQSRESRVRSRVSAEKVEANATGIVN